MAGPSNPQQPNVASDFAMLAERCIQRPFMTSRAPRRLAGDIMDVSPGPRSRSRYASPPWNYCRVRALKGRVIKGLRVTIYAIFSYTESIKWRKR